VGVGDGGRPDGTAPEDGGGPVAAGDRPAACVPSDLDAVDLHSNKTRYCSIYRFKGLESPAVVLTDIEDLDSPAACSLLYVGCTRALDRLVILAHESLRATLERGP
jgi:superfamily I DNA/RNA helicase